MANRRYQFNTLEEMLAYFLPEKEEGKYAEFDALCLQLCEAMGLKVKQRVRPDGSVKTELKFGEESGILKAYCYRPDIQIKRSELSGLVKDNQEIIASHIVVMSTSTFSDGAVSYAYGTGIRIVNGEQLFGLMKKHGLILERVVKPVVPLEDQVKDLREKKARPVEVQQEAAPQVPVRSPLARMASVQGQKPRSQGFNAREYMQNGRNNVKPFR